MENPHRAALQIARAADEPVAVGAFHLDIEQPRQPVVMGAAKVIVVHDGDAQSLRGGLQDQLA